jgi:hypothetical protein
VTIIFDLYANKRMGSRVVAQWLNRRGHRTKGGRPWSHTAVITVLTNRACVGEILFRGRYHPAPHPCLVEAGLFETAQAVLESRGEDMALRRTNGSEYLLTGLLLCEKCGKRFIGASAKGNAYRYTYYVCFSRHRHGTQECDLPPPRGRKRGSAARSSSTSRNRLHNHDYRHDHRRCRPDHEHRWAHYALERTTHDKNALALSVGLPRSPTTIAYRGHPSSACGPDWTSRSGLGPAVMDRSDTTVRRVCACSGRDKAHLVKMVR